MKKYDVNYLIADNEYGVGSDLKDITKLQLKLLNSLRNEKLKPKATKVIYTANTDSLCYLLIIFSVEAETEFDASADKEIFDFIMPFLEKAGAIVLKTFAEEKNN